MKTQHPLYEVRLPRSQSHKALVRPSIALVRQPATDLFFTHAPAPDGGLHLAGIVLQASQLIKRVDANGQHYYLRFRAQEIAELVALFAQQPQIMLGHTHQVLAADIISSAIDEAGNWSVSLHLPEVTWRQTAETGIELAITSTDGSQTWHQVAGFSLEALCMRLLVVGRTDLGGSILKLRKFPRLIKARLSADAPDLVNIADRFESADQFRLFWQEVRSWLQLLVQVGQADDQAQQTEHPEHSQQTSQSVNESASELLNNAMTELVTVRSLLTSMTENQQARVAALESQLSQLMVRNESHQQQIDVLRAGAQQLLERVNLLAEAPAPQPTGKRNAKRLSEPSVADQMVMKLRQINKARQAFD